MKITRTIIINDVHMPFHDSQLITETAEGMIFEIIDELKLDRLIVAGDLLDMFNVSMHGPKHPSVATNLEDELNVGRIFFENIKQKFPDLEVIFLFGNHEHRLDRWIVANAKPFYNILSIEKHLRLEELGIEYHYYNTAYRLEDTNCFIQHSPPSYGVNGTRTSLLRKMDRTYIYGCTHREQKSCTTGASGQVYAAYFNGWLGSVTETAEHAQVFSYAKGHENWQQAFTIVNVIDGKDFYINQYSIRDHRVCVDGFLFEGKRHEVQDTEVVQDGRSDNQSGSKEND